MTHEQVLHDALTALLYECKAAGCEGYRDYGWPKAMAGANAALAATAAPAHTDLPLRLEMPDGDNRVTKIFFQRVENGEKVVSITVEGTAAPEEQHSYHPLRHPNSDVCPKCAQLDELTSATVMTGTLMPDTLVPAHTLQPAEPAKDSDEDTYVIDQLGKLLAGVAIALKGTEKPLHRHGYQNLPELAEKMMLENAILKHQLANVAQPAEQSADAIRRKAIEDCRNCYSPDISAEDWDYAMLSLVAPRP